MSLAQPLSLTCENEGKLNEAYALKRRLDPLTVDRVNLIIKRLGERRSQLANTGSPDVKTLPSVIATNSDSEYEDAMSDAHEDYANND